MKKNGLIILIIPFLIGFYFAADWNYQQRKIEQQYIISKPSALPTVESAKLTSFGFSSVKADYYRLQLIQYIGGNIFNYSYKDYLYRMSDLITGLNPYFEDPYVVAELLLPSYNQHYEKLSDSKRKTHIDEAIKIGEKAVTTFCDTKKLALIKNEQNLEQLFSEKKYKNPCSNFEAIYNLAYIYFQYKNDPKTAAYYYKVTSVIEDSPEGAKNMIAIMNGKWGEREKSYFMQVNMARYTNADEVCTQVANDLETVWKEIFSRKEVPSMLLKNIEDIRKQAFPYSKEKLAEIECSTYINKAVRELNLYYLDLANNKYIADTENNAVSAKVLFDEKYIDYFPTDFQKSDDSQIIYFYDEKYWFFNYKMGSYEHLEKEKSKK